MTTTSVWLDSVPVVSRGLFVVPMFHRGWRSREVTISETESADVAFRPRLKVPVDVSRWIMHLLRASRRSLSVPLLRTSSGITIGSSGILDGFASRDIIGGNAAVWKSMIERRRICNKEKSSKLSIIMLMHASFYLFTFDTNIQMRMLRIHTQ